MSKYPNHGVPQSVAERFTYDPATGDLRWKIRPREDFPTERGWRIFNSQYGGALVTSVHRKGYLRAYAFGRSYLAHRIIAAIMAGSCPPHLQVDHINGDVADNRWSNLRLIYGGENQRNMKRAENNTSGVSGVVWDHSRERWQARIQINGKTRYLGRFDNKADAIRARKDAERQFGFHVNHGRAA